MPRPPRNYSQEEFPLYHELDYRFTLDGNDEAKNSALLSLARYTEGANAPDAIEVNPNHASYAEETGAICQPGSIIPRMTFQMDGLMNEALLETDKVKQIRFYWCPVYIAFLDSLTAIDNRVASTEIEDILELTHDATTHSTWPLFSGTDLASTAASGFGAQPLSTVNKTEAYTNLSLTTDAKLESVSFDSDTLFDCLQFYSNAGMMRKVMGSWRSEILNGSTSRMFHYYSNNYTHPAIKRMNEYTYCGVLVHLPVQHTVQQLPTPDITAGSGLEFHVKCKYPEWNHQFDQTAL